MSWQARIAHRSGRMWHVVDAKDEVVGRLAMQVSRLLQGKHKPIYTPYADCGDNVVVINAAEVKFTGKKEDQKRYRWHTGWAGGLKERSVRQFRERYPDRILRTAMQSMLPKNKRRKTRYNPRLHIVNGSEIPAELLPAVEASQAAHGEMLEAFRPHSTKVQIAERSGSVLMKEFFESLDPRDWDPSQLEEAQHDWEEVERLFAEAWVEETAFWARRHEEVPRHIYEEHGIAYPGDGEPSMPAAEAAAAFTAAARAFNEAEAAEVAAGGGWKKFVGTDAVDEVPAGWEGRVGTAAEEAEARAEADRWIIEQKKATRAAGK